MQHYFQELGSIVKKSKDSTSLDNSKILNGCLNKDPKYQRVFVEQFGKKLMVVCHRYATLSVEPSDIFQEAFIQIFSVLDQYEPTKGSLEGWLHRITVNVALKQIRKNKRYDEASGIEDVQQETFSTAINDNLSHQELLGFIRQLPEVQQLVFNLYAIDGYNHDEIGDQLGITASTSRSNYSRAKRKLQEMHQAYHNG